MIYRVCAIRDRAVDVFGQPIFFAHIGAAVRSFSDEVNRKVDGNQLAAHPEDFDLYELGSFDDSTGVFSQDVSPRQVAVGKDCVRD